MKTRTFLTGCLLAFAAALQAQNLVGGDLSMLPKYEAASVNYYDMQGNRIGEMLPFLRDEAGFNAVRVRLFVNPTGATGVVQDLDYVKTLARRVKEAGMQLMLDFHYSDTWADPSNQWTPDAWKTLSDDALAQQVYDYTRDCLQQLKAAGATPDYVQTGNEISYGMLWGPKGTGSPKKCYTNSDANWSRFRSLLGKAIEACREECPAAKVIIHTERTANWSATKGIYERLASVDYDIIGLSYYPEWHNNLSTLKTTLQNLKTTFAGKPVMIVETGYYNNWYPQNASYNFTSTWPASAAGQKKFLDDLVALIKDMDHIKGLLYWFPEENPYNNRVYEPWYNHGLFDPSTGKAVEALFSMKDLGWSSGVDAVAATPDEPSTVLHTLDGRRVNASRQLPRGVYVQGSRKVIVR